MLHVLSIMLCYGFPWFAARCCLIVLFAGHHGLFDIFPTRQAPFSNCSLTVVKAIVICGAALPGNDDVSRG
jgi:hypothetical protein